LRYFCNFQNTAQSKQSPKGEQFAQSGHPDVCPTFLQWFTWQQLFDSLAASVSRNGLEKTV
jgi:hypothetical protein